MLIYLAGEVNIKCYAIVWIKNVRKYLFVFIFCVKL